MVNITMSSASPRAGHAKNVTRPGEWRPAHLVKVKYHPRQKQPCTHNQYVVIFMIWPRRLGRAVRKSKKPRRREETAALK